VVPTAIQIMKINHAKISSYFYSTSVPEIKCENKLKKYVGSLGKSPL
jgi:hypothetical protein